MLHSPRVLDLFTTMSALVRSTRKSDSLFSLRIKLLFPTVLFRSVNSHSRASETAACRIKSRQGPLVRHCVWRSAGSATLCPGIIPRRDTRAVPVLLSPGHFCRGLTPVRLELRLQSRRGFIADLSSVCAKRWHSLLPRWHGVPL